MYTITYNIQSGYDFAISIIFGSDGGILVIQGGSPSNQMLEIFQRETADFVQETISKSLPTDLLFDEETAGGVDLTDVTFNSLGAESDVITLEFATDSGTLDAVSSGGVTVSGEGTDTLYLTGTRQELAAYLSDPDAVSYTGAKDVFGDDVAVISLRASVNGELIELGSINVDITDVQDDFYGTSKADKLTGNFANNVIFGFEGNDSLDGGLGDDIVMGGSGNDTVSGGAGADTLAGGDGSDVLYYRGSFEGVSVDLNEDAAGLQQASGGDAEGDIISSFEHVYASDSDDVVIGDDEKNILYGYAGDDLMRGEGGDDVLRGGLGADTLDGGAGNDWVRYLGSKAGVTVDLTADAEGIQSASGGDAEGDVLTGFENIQGSDYADNLTGDDGKNYFYGYDGDDVIDGGNGNDSIRGGEGADALDGGAGADVLQYIGSTGGVTVNLNADGFGAQQASGGDAEGDVISNFEHVYASDHDDMLTGDAGRNILYGYDGMDTLNGGEGKDVLRGGDGADSFVFDTALAPSNEDRIVDFESGEDVIVLDSNVFNALSIGDLDVSVLEIISGGMATTEDHRIIYDTDDGRLYYDSDGTGDADAVAFAQLTTKPLIDFDDFMIV